MTTILGISANLVAVCAGLVAFGVWAFRVLHHLAKIGKALRSVPGLLPLVADHTIQLGSMTLTLSDHGARLTGIEQHIGFPATAGSQQPITITVNERQTTP